MVTIYNGFLSHGRSYPGLRSFLQPVFRLPYQFGSNARALAHFRDPGAYGPENRRYVVQRYYDDGGAS